MSTSGGAGGRPPEDAVLDGEAEHGGGEMESRLSIVDEDGGGLEADHAGQRSFRCGVLSLSYKADEVSPRRAPAGTGRRRADGSHLS